ncbi:PREDICTED: metastasis-associated in colon cancer protein 1 [Crocodylus porosus]|uniref:Metastasis-associated in colon cancer protein 1 n=1 Tax=Crocodylus porosus TaxID=8502 RepID=A0A7M4FBU5_CROPO|nr:PREDICTED: metastasis-associated in colon cancer protein 1 [Crocodylus porosus]XP_019389901.1 PREDICTED: metastasis-associated in colon cancer protein 1 [Crocodylus porosus]
MSASRTPSLHAGQVTRSRSEGDLIDFGDGKPSARTNLADDKNKLDVDMDWSDIFKQHTHTVSETNPFRNELSDSNPFVSDLAESNSSEKKNKHISILKEDPYLFSRDSSNRDSFASSGDELDIDFLLQRTSARRSGKSKSISDFLDIVDAKKFDPPKTAPSVQILALDKQWLQNNRDAYKMAWLSHRQLARSCVNLDVMSRSPGWAQTQATDTHIVCKMNHEGGSVQLPNSDITIHIPKGHVLSEDFQEIGLRAILSPPASLNHELSNTVSPLLELTLSNLNTMEAILLEMKVAAKVKNDPFSQVMTEIVCFYSPNKEGPFEKIDNCYIYEDTIQVKLTNLSHVMYMVIAVQTNKIQSSAVTVWNYIHRTVSVGIYGPKHIHPSFTAVFTVFGHNYIPEKLTIFDIQKGGKTMPPIVFQLWGKNTFLLDKPQDLNISLTSCDPDFEVKVQNQSKGIKEEQLKAGTMVHKQFLFSVLGMKEIYAFVFLVQIKIPDNTLVTEFHVSTPDPAPKLPGVTSKPKRIQKRKEIKSAPFLFMSTVKYPKFQDKTLNITSYGVALKTVLRQNKVDYLLEYFKGDTIALLGEDRVKAMGQTKIKEWYVGVLRKKIGLVHCKNIKVILKEQAIDITESVLATRNLLEQIALPFKKLTYIYSVVLSTVSERVYNWRALADVLGYSHMSLDDFNEVQAEKESERVAYVVKKLKEDCHSNRSKRQFLYELITALLKLDCQGLVARITQDTVILTAAVKLGRYWRELAERLARLTKQQIEAYEVPHQGRNGEVAPEMMWKPAYDFLYTWGAHYGESYRDVLQDLQLALDKMKNPVTKDWRALTGALILVNCMEVLRASAFSKIKEEP